MLIGWLDSILCRVVNVGVKEWKVETIFCSVGCSTELQEEEEERSFQTKFHVVMMVGVVS